VFKYQATMQVLRQNQKGEITMNNKLFKFSAAIMFCFSLTIFTFAQNNRSLPVYLNVQIDDSASLASGIRSDGNGTYINGQSAVSAQFGQYGYFTFLSGDRIVNAIYPPPELPGTGDGTTPLPVSFDDRKNVQITTFVTSAHLQNMAVNAPPRCEGLAVNINMGDAAATKRTIGYRAGRGTLTNTGYVKITHPDSNTWIIESDTQGTCNSLFENIARIRDSKNKGRTVPDTDYGRYSMPFRLILTRQ
jgi:hypothetical protein